MMRVNVTFATLGVLLLAMGSSDACRQLGKGCSAHIGCCGGMACMSTDGMWGFCQQNRSKRQSDDEGGEGGEGGEGDDVDEGDEADEGDEGVSGTSHIVADGETLFTIGMKYGKDWRQIATDNNLANPNFIYPGQVLVLN